MADVYWSRRNKLEPIVKPNPEKAARVMRLLKALRDEAFKMGFSSQTDRMRDLDFHHDRVQALMEDLAFELDLDIEEARKWDGD